MSWCWPQKGWHYVPLFCLSLWACDSRRQEPSIAKVKGADERTQDYQKSYFFDKKVSDLRRRIQAWNQAFYKVLETQANGVHLPIITNTIEIMLPVLKESQRGFFKKTGTQWKKGIHHSIRLHPEKDYLLEDIDIVLEGGDAASEKNASWQVKAIGKYPKDKQGELFQIAWDGINRGLKIQSQINGETPFECHFQFSKINNELESTRCKNLLIFRVDNKDISIDSLNFDLHKGFAGEGTIKKEKGLSEKWELRPAGVLTPVVITPGSGGEG